MNFNEEIKHERLRQGILAEGEGSAQLASSLE